MTQHVKGHSVQPAETVPFADLALQWNEIAADVRPDFEDLFAQSAFCLGPFVERFEGAIADYLGARFAVGVNSGTSALHLAMLGCDLAPGDEVLVPAHTFIATVWGVLYAGLKPVFCDVESRTGNIDLADAARRLTPRVKAIVPVHLYGQPADMAAVMAFAARNGLAVVEDAAQAVGARIGDRFAGTMGRFGCFSFYPGKNLGAAGEAGLVVTDDERLAERLRMLRNHGQKDRYVHLEVGFNYRLEGLQAVVLYHKLKRLDAWGRRRTELARRYSERLQGLPISLPETTGGDHVWHLYVIRSPERDALRDSLARNAVASGLHYPVPCHRQPCLESFVDSGATFPEAERWANECLSLPLFYGMTDSQHDRVCVAIRRHFERR